MESIRRKYSDIFSDSLTLCGTVVKFSSVVKNLGVHLENDITLNSHIKSIIRSSYFALRELWQIRPSLTLDLAKTLASSFIHSRLDYCNSILAGCTKTQFEKLNRVLKAAARFVFNLPRFSPVSEEMVSTLHWLPFPQRVEYKVSLLSFKSCNGLAPDYIGAFYIPVASSSYRSRLRSSTTQSVIIPPIKTDCFGRRGFFYAGPAQWNSLPNYLRCSDLTIGQFCTNLKTHLFSIYTA